MQRCLVVVFLAALVSPPTPVQGNTIRFGFGPETKRTVAKYYTKYTLDDDAEYFRVVIPGLRLEDVIRGGATGSGFVRDETRGIVRRAAGGGFFTEFRLTDLRIQPFQPGNPLKTTGFIDQSALARISRTSSWPNEPAPYTSTRRLRLLRADATRLIDRNDTRVATTATVRSSASRMKTPRENPSIR